MGVRVAGRGCVPARPAQSPECLLVLIMNKIGGIAFTNYTAATNLLDGSWV